MSQIDQAFIRAYGEPQAETAILKGSTHVQQQTRIQPETEPVPAPHILSHPAVQEKKFASSATTSPEPIPAPHFQIDAFGAIDTSIEVAAIPAMETVQSSAPVPPVQQQQVSSERRPLSSFSAPEQPSTIAFHPVFEVDGFRWPKTVVEMLGLHRHLLAPVVDQLQVAREAGRTMVGVAGTAPGVGCTTVYLCLARLLAEAGLEVALVDANFARGSLAQELGLDFDTGWRDVLIGKNPLAESVVKSLEEGLALLPLAGPVPDAAELLASIQTSVSAGVLRYHYDLVLFDLGAPVPGEQRDATRKLVENCRLDASLIVADTSENQSYAGEAMDSVMELLGATCHGLIGNQAA